MSIQKSEGILLSKRDIRETSCIALFYTEGFGKIKGLIKAVRGPEAKFGLYLREFARYDVVFYQKTKVETHLVTQCDLRDAYPEIADDLYKRLNAYYLLELIDKYTPPEEKEPEIYRLLLWILGHIRRERFIDKAVIIFQLKLLEYTGFLPQLEDCTGCSNRISKDIYFSARLGGLLCNECRRSDIQVISLSRGAVATINQVRRHSIENLGRLTVSNDIAKEIGRLLDRFIEYHLGEHLKSQEFIRETEAAGVF